VAGDDLFMVHRGLCYLPKLAMVQIGKAPTSVELQVCLINVGVVEELKMTESKRP
jgi:hypothetical protein